MVVGRGEERKEKGETRRRTGNKFFPEKPARIVTRQVPARPCGGRGVLYRTSPGSRPSGSLFKYLTLFTVHRLSRGTHVDVGAQVCECDAHVYRYTCIDVQTRGTLSVCTCQNFTPLHAAVCYIYSASPSDCSFVRNNACTRDRAVVNGRVNGKRDPAGHARYPPNNFPW